MLLERWRQQLTAPRQTMSIQPPSKTFCELSSITFRHFCIILRASTKVLGSDEVGTFAAVLYVSSSLGCLNLTATMRLCSCYRVAHAFYRYLLHSRAPREEGLLKTSRRRKPKPSLGNTHPSCSEGRSPTPKSKFHTY